jgi:hypothetical protein
MQKAISADAGLKQRPFSRQNSRAIGVAGYGLRFAVMAEIRCWKRHPNFEVCHIFVARA